MAWSNLAVVGNTFSRDYLHDFNAGPFSLNFNLDIAAGLESFSIGFQHYLNTDINNTSFLNGYAVLADSIGSGLGMIVNYTSYFAVDGSKFTRVNFFGSSAPNGVTLAGPYNFVYTAPGSYSPTFILYEHKSTTGFGFGPIPSPPYPGIHSKATKSFAFDIIQQAVAVTRKNNNVGPLVTDGSTINDMDTVSNNTITLDKTNNRGDTVISEWLIQKQDPNGVFQNAVNGTDYALVGTLTSDTITITWGTPGVYRIVNHVAGPMGVQTGLNSAASYLNLNVGQSVIDTITLPIVLPIITPVVSYNNTVTNTSPLTGVENFSITVTANVDTSNAIWTQQIDSNPPIVLPMSLSAWENELTSRCTIKMRVKQGNTVIQSADGFGPFTFTLPHGDYQVGFEVRPKVGNNVNSTLVNVNQIVSND